MREYNILNSEDEIKRLKTILLKTTNRLLDAESLIRHADYCETKDTKSLDDCLCGIKDYLEKYKGNNERI